MHATAVLQRQALVLNRDWVPFRTTTVQEAIGLVAKGAAMIVEPETYQVHDLRSWNDVSRARERLVRSARLALAVPEVILLRVYAGRAEGSVVFSRRNLHKRDRLTCQYCGAQPGAEELTIDHLVPRSRGGRSTWENCVLACVTCNSRKADRTPAEAGLRLRRTPRKPTWRALARVPAPDLCESWDRFLSRAYWDVELDP